MENECEALPGVAYPGARDNRSTINTKTGYDDDWCICNDAFDTWALCKILRIPYIRHVSNVEVKRNHWLFTALSLGD